ncbi:nucleotidyltransferase-like protein [Paenibacillus sp. GYB003]|uniref:nucleotidyltransferase-like protein n=1 Tax=Paenibacillus sp. GYB003 TaxID=2994392 RepID=UPI002F968F4B
MDEIVQYVQATYGHDPETVSVAVARCSAAPYHAAADNPEFVVLVVQTSDPSDSTTYYIKDDIRIQERCLHPGKLERLLWNGENHSVIYWILQGEIVMDRNLYLEGLRHRLLEFPEDMRGKKLIVEFDRFLKSFLQGKQFLAEGHLLDAYSNILDALCRWARIAVLEEGIHPEPLIWAQVRKINPGVYKFYEELTSNNESLEKRIQLVVLACEFSVMSKMESCCAVVLEVLRSRERPWSLRELMQIPQLCDLDLDLSLLLGKLARKSLVREVVEKPDEPGSLLLQLKYTIQ